MCVHLLCSILYSDTSVLVQWERNKIEGKQIKKKKKRTLKSPIKKN